MTFDHRDDGTAEREWTDSQAFVDWPPLELPATPVRIVVLAAHPDDETLGAGGLVWLAGSRALSVQVIVASDGEASHPESTTHTPSDLARVRRVETGAAVARLYPDAQVSPLGLPDGELADHESELTKAVSQVLGDSDEVWLLAPWIGDRHPDHEACARAARAAAGLRDRVRVLEYPIWGWHWSAPDRQDLPVGSLRRILLPDQAVRAKTEALDLYRSQVAPLSDRVGDEAVVSPAMRAHFERSFETLIEVGEPMIDVESSAAALGYFDALYATDDDPWRLGERFYEHRKRQVLLSSLPAARFVRAFEPGCAIGLLSEQLAKRCDELVATDVAARAVELTRTRLAGATGVTVEVQRIPGEWPAGEFDLIVLSEVGYYCPDLRLLLDRVLGSLSEDGVVAACHWRHPAHDHPQSADQVHAVLGRGLQAIVTHVEPDFLLNVWTRAGRSVAQAEGIVA